MLLKCHGTLVEGFNESLIAAISSFPSPSQPQQDQQQVKKAASLVHASQLDNVPTRGLSANLIHLQALLFMAVQAGNHPPRSSRSQSTGYTMLWLTQAVGLAYQLKLHVQRQPEKGAESDPDSDDKLARRAWWTLVIMDRWHASSTASPLLIPDSSVVIYREDRALLGESIYQLARECLAQCDT